MTTLPKIYLVRHGETEWSLTGRHTGRTDVPLTPRGEARAADLRLRLRPFHFDHILTSPSLRARRTCQLAGYAHLAKIDEDLHEWDYGPYEGLTTQQIHATNPAWNIFRDGSPAESPAQMSARADRVISRLRQQGGDTLLFSSGHFLRSLAARWTNLPVSAGQSLACDPASLSILSYEHNPSDPVIKMWNECPASD